MVVSNTLFLMENNKYIAVVLWRLGAPKLKIKCNKNNILSIYIVHII